MANALGIYHICKQNGIPDSNIILLIADDVACNPRNVFPGQIFCGISNPRINLYDEDIEIDYRGYEVTVENFLRVLSNRHENVVSKHKRLKSNENSNILIYLSGHGGDEFLKFQDHEEITAEDMSNVIKQMEIKKQFNEILIVLDTCQAGTLFKKMDSKGVITAASSSLGESSYSHENDFEVGVSVIDRFTHYTVDFFERIKKKNSNWQNNIRLEELFSIYDPKALNAHPEFVTKNAKRNMSEVLLSDFFAANILIDFDYESYRVKKNEKKEENEEQEGVCESKNNENDVFTEETSMAYVIDDILLKISQFTRRNDVFILIGLLIIFVVTKNL